MTPLSDHVTRQVRNAAVAVLVLGSTTSVHAQTALTLQLLSPKVCTLAAPTAGALNSNDFTGSTLAFTAGVNATTAKVQSTDAELDLLAMCNHVNAKVTLKSTNGIMTRGPTISTIGNFRQSVSYTVSGTVLGGTNTFVKLLTGFNADGNAGSTDPRETTVGSVFNGRLAINIGITGGVGADPLIEGIYSDVLTITLVPST